jgi:hypothetical protein
VNLSSSGRYRCEVSGEAPSFNTVDGYGDMTVVGKLLLLFFIIHFFIGEFRKFFIETEKLKSLKIKNEY